MSDSNMEFVSKENKDTWQTPEFVYEKIAEVHGGIDTDPCAGADVTGGETSIAENNIRPPQNGLTSEWPGVVFMNMPFSEKVAWLKKAVDAVQNGEATTVYALTPDSTDVMSWWHAYIAKHAVVTFFPYGRVEYVDPDADDDESSSSGVSFGSAISVFGEQPPQELLDFWTDDSEEPHGDLVVRPQNGFEL